MLGWYLLHCRLTFSPQFRCRCAFLSQVRNRWPRLSRPSSRHQYINHAVTGCWTNPSINPAGPSLAVARPSLTWILTASTGPQPHWSRMRCLELLKPRSIPTGWKTAAVIPVRFTRSTVSPCSWSTALFPDHLNSGLEIYITRLGLSNTDIFLPAFSRLQFYDCEQAVVHSCQL